MIIETTINLKNKSKEELILLLNESLGVIEKLQKENERLIKQVEYDKTHIYHPQYIKLNYIPVQKVKDKIEEIQEEGYWLFTTDRDSDKCVDVLQELIEEREEKENGENI